MQGVFDMIAQVAKSDTPVLIRGESGVGKELVGHAIHYNSDRTENGECWIYAHGLLLSDPWIICFS